MDTWPSYRQLSLRQPLKYAQMPVWTTRMLIRRQTAIQSPPPVLPPGPPPSNAPSPIVLMGALNASFVVRFASHSTVRSSQDSSFFMQADGILFGISLTAPGPKRKLTPLSYCRHSPRTVRDVLLHPPHLPTTNTMVHPCSRMRHVRNIHSRHRSIHKTIHDGPMGTTPTPSTILHRQNASKSRLIRNQQVRLSFLISPREIDIISIDGSLLADILLVRTQARENICSSSASLLTNNKKLVSSLLGYLGETTSDSMDCTRLLDRG